MLAQIDNVRPRLSYMICDVNFYFDLYVDVYNLRQLPYYKKRIAFQPSLPLSSALRTRLDFSNHEREGNL